MRISSSVDFWYFLLRRKDRGATESATETPRIWLEKQTLEPARFPQTGWSKTSGKKTEMKTENCRRTRRERRQRLRTRHRRRERVSNTHTRDSETRISVYPDARGPSGGCPVRPRPGKTPGYQSHAPNLAESDGTGPVAVGLLHAAGGGGGLASRLGGELLAGGLASRGFARRLLGTSHGSGGL